VGVVGEPGERVVGHDRRLGHAPSAAGAA
jgi:hypothetical protein